MEPPILEHILLREVAVVGVHLVHLAAAGSPPSAPLFLLRIDGGGLLAAATAGTAAAGLNVRRRCRRRRGQTDHSRWSRDPQPFLAEPLEAAHRPLQWSGEAIAVGHV